MSTALEETTTELRRRLLNGSFLPDTKLREAAVAEALGVSRTLARLAMSALEHEGLLQREANRGSRVRQFSIDEITDAIEVRGELEAMAVRKVAERGLDPNTEQSLRAILAESETLLARNLTEEDDHTAWTTLNTRFHDQMIAASENWALKASILQVSGLPLVSASALIFDRTNQENAARQLALAHDDHVAIFKAVQSRQGHRAEARMREHAFRSAANKRKNLTDPAAMSLARRLPGGALIAEAT